MKNLVLVFSLLFAYQLITAQITYKISAEDEVNVSVKGSSTLHEWEAVASEIADYPPEILTASDGSINLDNFGFTVSVESLDGGRGDSMNKKIRKALIATEHPTIIFNASEVDIIDGENTNEKIVKSKGTLQIAGKHMEVEVDATLSVNGEQLIISGSKSLKMSDFGIEPPSAMFGQIITRDDIVVHYEFNYLSQ